MKKSVDTIKLFLNEHELLKQLAEECSELSQAALKAIRAKGYSLNWTPKSKDEAQADLIEEAQDVMSLLYLLGILPDDIENYWKYDRWADRLIQQTEYKQHEEKC